MLSCQDYEYARPNRRVGKCVCKPGFVQVGTNFACERKSELVFNQNAPKSRTRVGFQSKCLKEQDVRRCDAGKAVFVFSRFSPRGSASPFNDNIRTNKKHKTSAQSVIAYPKECSSGIIGRGMNNAADSSPVSDLQGKNANKTIFSYQIATKKSLPANSPWSSHDKVI